MSTASTIMDVNELTVCSALLCTVTGCACKYPHYLTIGEDVLCCCFKSNMVCCKLYDERRNSEGKLCACSEGGCFLVKPTTCCQSQSQFCCLDTRCALPCTDQVPMICTCLPCCVLFPKFGCFKKVKDLKEVTLVEATAPQDKPKQKDLTDTPIEEILVIDACCCSICGFYCKFPECLGAKTELICTCCQGEQTMCKPITETNADKICCVCCNGGSYLVMPRTCCQVSETCFCIDSRCALPPTDKTPCLCTLLPGCVVYPAFKCCAKVSDILPPKDEGKVAPAQMEMVVSSS